MDFQSIMAAVGGYGDFRAAELARLKAMPRAAQRGAEHIFYDLIEFLAAEDKALKLQLRYYFHTYQDCLTYCRAGSLNLAKVQMAFIEKNLALDMDKRTVLGMEAIYFPMRAYYCHKFREPLEAVRLLEGSIARFEALREMGFEAAESAVLEQRLNVCRVYFEVGDVEMAIEESVGLLEAVAAYLVRVPQGGAEEAMVVGYYLGALLDVAFKLEGAGLQWAYRALVDAVLAWEETAPHLVQPYFELLQGMRERDDAHFVDDFARGVYGVFRCPGSVQLVLWVHLCHLAMAYGFGEKLELGEMIAGYLQDVVKVKAEKFQKILYNFILQDHVVQ